MLYLCIFILFLLIKSARRIAASSPVTSSCILWTVFWWLTHRYYDKDSTFSSSSQMLVTTPFPGHSSHCPFIQSIDLTEQTSSSTSSMGPVGKLLTKSFCLSLLKYALIDVGIIQHSHRFHICNHLLGFFIALICVFHLQWFLLVGSM